MYGDKIDLNLRGEEGDGGIYVKQKE